MQEEVRNEAYQVINQYFDGPQLNQMLKSFVEEKVVENSVWSEFTELAYRMFGGKDNGIFRVGACTELLMLALDIIDDLQDQDNADKSWTQQPFDRVMNAAVALLVAVTSDIQLLQHRFSNLSVAKVQQYLLIAAEGQDRDLANEVETEEDYVALIQRKSAVLAQLSCYMGYACLEHVDEEQTEKLNQAAGLVGMAAQIGNDMRDTLRFNLKNDLLRKKKTLATMYLLEHDHPYTAIKDYYNGLLDEDTFVQLKQEAVEYMKDSGVEEYCTIIQGLHVEEAEKLFAAIDGLEPYKAQLADRMFAAFNSQVGR